MESEYSSPEQIPESKTRCILDMSPAEARGFFLKATTYSDVEMPRYFDFGPLLLHVSEYLGDRRLSDFYAQGKKPGGCEDVNYKFYSSRDGKYSWRPYQFIHPALYVSLAHRITEPDNWKIITKRFADFTKDSRILCVSLPIESMEEKSDKAAMVSHWYKSIEQDAIKLALDFEYVFHTDVTDCYG
ncbi:MAG: reverse transcriptase, partial [Candidatus Hydrogenedentes bacterium]|nr:reverse transcriptase [Candidatus Hydrogenedentota bacterium]